MNETLLVWYQALQLLALGPCLFMLFFLCVAGRRISQILVPMLYFLSLACSFVLPFQDILKFVEQTHAALFIIATAEAAVGFLFIVQCVAGSLPPLPYWSIFAVPLLGGSQIVYATVMADGDLCIFEHICAQPLTFHILYSIFTVSLVCLLTVMMYRRLDKRAQENEPWRTRQKYALILALIVLNLALLGIDLMQVNGYTDLEHARFAKSVVRIGFIYLMLTMMFRLYDHVVEIAYERVPSIKPTGPSEKEFALAAQIRELFMREKTYRDMELGREKLARKLAVTEGVLSRVVNLCFQENVSMLINHYRVEEAKERLTSEETSITAIAFEVGFSSIPSFNRVFRDLTDMSPSEYRSKHTPKPIATGG